MKRAILILSVIGYLLPANTLFAYTHADTLRGSNGRGRSWWDVQKYYLTIRDINIENKSISGSVTIQMNVTETPVDSMQIDLQQPLVIDKIICDGKDAEFVREGNVWWVKHPFHNWAKGSSKNVEIIYHGNPRVAVRPPWDGGISWSHDDNNKPWLAVSCQGLGASVWWPCKDAQWEEPDKGMDMYFVVPRDLSCVSNGRLIDKTSMSGSLPSKTADVMWHWQLKNPINNYDVSFYIGDYVHWHDTATGEKGTLDLDFWVLRQNEEKAKKQFAVTKQMIHCFEYWMGPYPFYEDGYKLVDAPYLGMEHQGAIAYGNEYKMGYRGYDRSKTGYGLSFDYIIIHESAHEWFGNNITAADVCDEWIQEGVTTYAEGLFAECILNKEKGEKYNRGCWELIDNDKPLIGPRGVQTENSGDIYEKGSAIMYMIRKMTNDDEKFRQMLRGLGQEFYHGIVTSAQVEAYIAKNTGLDLKAFFDHYLRKAEVPELEYAIKDGELSYRFDNVAAGFSVPVTATSGDNSVALKPTSEWQKVSWKGGYDVKFSKDFLIRVKK